MAEETKSIESLLGELKDEVRRQVKAERAAKVEAGDTSSRAMSAAALAAIKGLLDDAAILFEEFGVTYAPSDRERLISVGLRNLGFLQTAYSQAQSNPGLIPSYMSMAEFKEGMGDLDRKRILLTLVEQFAKNISDSLLADSDSVFHDALEFYDYTRTAARQRVPGAEVVYNVLRPYFLKRRPVAKGHPTEKQLERDLHGLLSGAKEGKLEVVNENPDPSGGHRHVVDEVHTADVKKKD